MSGKSPAAFAILANSGSAIRIWWSGEERERAERIAAEDFAGLPIVELYTGDAMREVEQQRDVLLAALRTISEESPDEGAREYALNAIAAVERPAAEQAADADGWTEWNGGECPVPSDALVGVKFANGEDQPAIIPAEEWDWSHGDCQGFDIIAYRVVKGNA